VGFSEFFNLFFSGAAAGAAGATAGPGRGRRPTGGPTFEDILAGMGLDGAGATASSGTRTTSQPKRQPRPSAEAVAEITLDEAFHGTTRLLEVEGKRLEVTIPKGADTGTRIRLSGKAPGGGDLHVVVRQTPDGVYTRKGANLERELPITLGEALLGAEVPVRTPKGRVLLTIPAGTQAGRMFRLSGRGLPRFKADGFGDVLVRIRVVLPTDLSDDARDAARRFIDLTDQPDPRPHET
jgi:curved DNA-binding protein